MPAPSSRLRGIVPSGKDGWEVHFTALQRHQMGEPIIMLSVGDHDFHTPSQTVEACVEAVRAGHHHYTQLAGLPLVRKAMARISTLSTGIETVPENIIAAPGGQLSLYAAVYAVLDPGDHAIVVSPYYATYPSTFRATGAEFSVVEARSEDGFQPDIEALEQAITPRTRAILINTPNNPTGAIYTRASLETLADLCKRHDLWLISDEVYWTITGGREHLSPRGLDGMAERTLVVNSMSKSHGMTGWRIGWVTGPQSIVSLMLNFNLITTFGLPDFVSRAAALALANDWGVEEIAKRYGDRRKIFIDAFAGVNDAQIRGSEGGMYIMLDISAVEPDCEAFAWSLLEAENISVMPGSSFGDSAAGHVRISLCQPDAVLADAAKRIGSFIANYGRQERLTNAS